MNITLNFFFLILYSLFRFESKTLQFIIFIYVLQWMVEKKRKVKRKKNPIAIFAIRCRDHEFLSVLNFSLHLLFIRIFLLCCWCAQNGIKWNNFIFMLAPLHIKGFTCIRAHRHIASTSMVRFFFVVVAKITHFHFTRKTIFFTVCTHYLNQNSQRH